MKRRDFGILAGASAVAATNIHHVCAQAAPDPSLLTTTLTPLGAERGGNSDGSIPAWMGGMTADPGSPVAIKVFEDEQPLFVIDANNLAQHQDKLAHGIQKMITDFGFSCKVYPTHRTAAAPQYVYDNTAKNVTRAQFSAAGGRFGFTGAYGGVPFPIVNASDSAVAGAQLIWNHLTAWQGFSFSSFSPGYVMIDGQPLLSEAGLTYFFYPYYDPNGSPETFDGYLSKTHLYFKAPPNFDGQEVLVWHSVNIQQNSDIVWELLNGQGRVRKAPDLAYDTPSGYYNAIFNQDENSGFYGNPSQYDWRCVGKQEMYIPYHCNNIAFTTADAFLQSKYPNPDYIRWEKHRVWVLEANLHPGIRNVMARRRFYLDEDTWFIATGESYDSNDKMARIYLQLSRATPAVPATSPVGFVVFNPLTGDYAYAGYLDAPPYSVPAVIKVWPNSLFEPEQMSANASF